MKYIVELSYLLNESSVSYIHVDYIVKAKDMIDARNKAITKVIKEANPYHFVWNSVHEYSPNFNFRSDTPLII